MQRRLEVAPILDDDLKARLAREGLKALWTSAEPLAGGRETARLTRIGGHPAVVKRERRGGILALALPDWYLFRGPFEREWRLASRLASLGLAPRPLAQEFFYVGPVFQVFDASEALSPAQSLLGIWQGGGLTAEHLRRAGNAVGRLHRAGVVHGDLNAGNIMLVAEGDVSFLDLRHSRTTRGDPAPALRRRNLSRLARSLHKIGATRGLALPAGAWPAIAEGYAAGWGAEEAWASAWLRRAEAGYPVRGLLWRKVPPPGG